MKILKYLDLGGRKDAGPLSGLFVLVPILALIGCKALGLGFAATLITVVGVGAASSAFYVSWHLLKERHAHGDGAA